MLNIGQSGEVPDLPEWLKEGARSKPNDRCRRRAHECGMSLRDASPVQVGMEILQLWPACARMHVRVGIRDQYACRRVRRRVRMEISGAKKRPRLKEE